MKEQDRFYCDVYAEDIDVETCQHCTLDPETCGYCGRQG